MDRHITCLRAARAEARHGERREAEGVGPSEVPGGPSCRITGPSEVPNGPSYRTTGPSEVPNGPSYRTTHAHALLWWTVPPAARWVLGGDAAALTTPDRQTDWRQPTTDHTQH